MGGSIQKTGFPPENVEFDDAIDVRSPSEFEEDHITGAINLPVLDDRERAEVGTIYKQVSPFEARKVGAAMASRNIARHLETYLLDKPSDYRPLIYCWRGGDRSRSLATVLASVGWNVLLIEGGYRTYRRHVIRCLTGLAEASSFRVLDGLTGAGKTAVLKELRNRGRQVLELEGLANHKGSVFGGDPDRPQPAQKRFESLICDELLTFDPSIPVFLEAESAKIGNLNIPNPLWQKMKAAPVIELHSPLPERASFLMDDYRDWLEDADRILMTFERLRRFHSAKQLDQWRAMTDRKSWQELIESLLENHYDKRYRPKHGRRPFQPPQFRIRLTPREQESIANCAGIIEEQVLGNDP